MTTPQGPWAPYRPSAADPWDAGKVAHLHRRAGLGATWAELRRDLRDGPEASVARLLNPTPPTDDERQVLDGLRQGVLSGGDTERFKAWWLYQLLFGRDALRERLALCWHGHHFAASNLKVRSITLMLAQNELFRRHALGEFSAFLTDVIADVAMLVWLDGGDNRRGRPNENFAREFLELFTLGPGNYMERDVREAARAFTGWVREREQPVQRFRFDPSAHDDGEKTFLGLTGRWNAADVVRITLERPAAAEFLCRKLYRWLVSDEANPPADLIRPLAAELRASRYSVRRVVEVILRSRHFYDRAARRQRVKSPVELTLGLLRVLEVPRANVRLLAASVACARQGQDLFHPPNVRGWVGGRTWLNSSTVLERGNWCNDVVWGNPDLGMPPFDPVAWVRRNGVAPADAAGAFVDLLLQGDVHADDRAAVLNAGRDGSPDGLRRALQLALHCPEFQLA